MATPRLRLGLAIDLGSPLRGTGRSAAIAGPDAGLALAERAGRLDAPKVLAARQLAEGAHGAPHGREGSAGRGASRVCSCARRGRTLRVWRRGRGGHRRLRGLRRGARRGTPRAIDLGARPRDRGLGLFDRAWRFVRSLAPCGRRWLASAGRATAPERPWKAREPASARKTHEEGEWRTSEVSTKGPRASTVASLSALAEQRLREPPAHAAVGDLQGRGA